MDRDEEIQALFDRFKDLDRKGFRASIREVKDDHLRDLRYKFDWDPDPRKSTMQAIEINRLLTERKARRQALPQWIGIVVSNLIALAALIVSLLK